MTFFIKFLRILLGMVFIASAVLKLISIDEFELYIYSHNILSLNLSFIAARLVIGFEFFIGLMLIINLYFKKIWVVSVITLLIFTIYLGIISIKGNTENCHCFGELLKMNPVESIIKNAMLILLFLILRKNKGFDFRYKLIVVAGLLVIGFSVPLTVSPPDFLYAGKYEKLTVINEDGFESIVFNSYHFPDDIDKGKKVMCFYSTSCHFCRLSEKKISSMVVRNDLDSSKFLNIFWGDSNSLEEFYNENGIRFESIFIPVHDFLSITEGVMPVILLVEDKIIKEKFGYRNINEKAITEFLKN